MHLDEDEESALHKLVATVTGGSPVDKSPEGGVVSVECPDAKKHLKGQLRSHTAGLVRKRFKSRHGANN